MQQHTLKTELQQTIGSKLVSNITYRIM